MKFSLKSAGQYSNALSNLIDNFANVYRGQMGGLCKVTELHQKSKLNTGTLGVTYEDEEKEIKADIPFFQVDPNLRIKILEDLVAEKNAIDAKINEKKADLTLVSPISGKTLNIDFAKKENTLYQRTLINAYSNCIETKERETEKVGKFQTIVDDKSVTLEYPIIVTETPLIDVRSAQDKYIALKEKLQKESDEIDRLQAGTTVEFDNKFSTFDTIDSIIAKYQEN